MTLADQPVGSLKGVGPKRETALSEAGIATIGDLLLRLPRRYSDRRVRHAPDAAALTALLEQGTDQVTVEGFLVGVRRVFTRRRGLSLVQGKIMAESPTSGTQGGYGGVRCVWFNRPYLANSVDASKRVALSGTIRKGRSGLEFLNPDIASDEEPPSIVAHYTPVGGLGDKALRGLMAQILAASSTVIDDPVPGGLLHRHSLPELEKSLRFLHDPPLNVDWDDLSRGLTPAHQRLVYGDLLGMQLELARARAQSQGQRKPHRYRIDDEVRQLTREMLPFRLTDAQRRSLGEIVADLKEPAPMLRLLQGDVGCGKTVVAAAAALVAAESGHQVAYLSPTEMLAEQVALELRKLLSPRHDVGLLTSSSSDGSRARQALRSGALKIVSGTHALLQRSVEFSDLGLVIIDEQHRFGVQQRLAMANKGHQPDMLLMTATPIPRSLALAVFGDLAVSTIDQLPPGRGKVTTQLVCETERKVAIRAVRIKLETGSRAFVVFPRIEESEEGTVSLRREGRHYRELAPSKVAVLTGSTEASDRQRILRAFRSGEVNVLLATTVIEVGIDVPDATLMVIEGADRFGLSQLHQLRGRVGRSADGGHCLALYANGCAEDTLARLETFAASTDGFELAEHDLRARGPGNLLGVEQTGFSQWTADRLANAVHWLDRASEDAREIASAEVGTVSSDSRHNHPFGAG